MTDLSEFPDRPLRVLHLVGSEVSSFFGDLSRLYAADCLRSTQDPDRYEVHIAHVSTGGVWRFPADLRRPSIEAAEPMLVGSAIRMIESLDVDVMVPQMFCLPGMTAYRSLFDLLGIPFLGNRPDVMALAANKARARAVVAAAGVSVPVGQVLLRGERPTLGVPAVVKPVDTDNSVGVVLVRDVADYGQALETAFAHGDQVLVEEYVDLGREVRCGVLEIDGELVCLPLEEYAVDPLTKPIRGEDDKLRRDEDGELGLVAKDAVHAWIVDPGDPVTEAVWAAARECHRALGCRDYSLFDFRIDPEGHPWFLEAGLYCSFAEKSVVSVMAGAAGIPLPELFGRGLEQAMSRSTRTASQPSSPGRSAP